MRILLTTDTVGGVWTFTRELSREFLARGNDVALVSFGRFAAPDQHRWIDTMHRRHGSHFVFRESDVPLEWMQNNAEAFDGGVELLSSTATEFGAEIIHSNQFCWGAIPLHLRRIITAHSDVLSWAAICAPEGLQQSHWLDRYCTFVQAGLDAADAVVSPTQWMQKHYNRTSHCLQHGVSFAMAEVFQQQMVVARADFRPSQWVVCGTRQKDWLRC